MNQRAKYNWKGRSFLIAEDDDSSSRYLEILIMRNGAEVKKTNNGIDAFIECIKNPAIDVALIDIKLPRLNGLETVRLLKKYRPDLICIAETGYISNDDIFYMKAYRFDDYLLKPIDRKLFYSTLQKHLDNYKSKSFVHLFHYN